MVLAISTAFVLGAGLGTRLRPLTNDCPKPLLPLGGRPAITWAFDHLLAAGIKRLIVNTHHCADRYEEAFPTPAWRGVPIIFRHEPALLDTAGGIRNVADLLEPDEPLLVYNGDVVADLPLDILTDYHARSGNEVSLIARTTAEPRHLILDGEGRVIDIRGALGAPDGTRALFAGIYIVEPAFIRRIPQGAPVSVIPIFLDMIRQGGGIGAVIIDHGTWREIGTIEAYRLLRDKLDSQTLIA